MRNRVNEIKAYRYYKEQAIMQAIRRANFALYDSKRSSKASACRCLIMGLRYIMRYVK